MAQSVMLKVKLKKATSYHLHSILMMSFHKIKSIWRKKNQEKRRWCQSFTLNPWNSRTMIKVVDQMSRIQAVMKDVIVFPRWEKVVRFKVQLVKDCKSNQLMLNQIVSIHRLISKGEAKCHNLYHFKREHHNKRSHHQRKPMRNHRMKPRMSSSSESWNPNRQEPKDLASFSLNLRKPKWEACSKANSKSQVHSQVTWRKA